MIELEEKFYKTFGIEPKHEDCCSMADKYWANEELTEEYITFGEYMTKVCPEQNKVCYETCEYAYWSEVYPPITDHILLRLECILRKRSYAHCLILFGKTIDDIKEEVLQKCVNIAFAIQDDVRKLFEEQQR